MNAVDIVTLSPIPSVAVHQLNQLIGRRVHINLTGEDGPRVDTGYVSSASVIGSKGTKVDGPVASFRQLGAHPRGPFYNRHALADIVSLEVYPEPKPAPPVLPAPDPAATTGVPAESWHGPAGDVHIPTIG